MSKNHRSTCRLLHYTAERAVSCLDALHRSRYPLSGKSKIANKLHFVFMGDSRIRQQFYNFLRLIPDHDRRSNPSPIPLIYHGDIEVSSEILRLRVSFKWRPLVDDNVTETLRHWAISDRNEQPDLILFSMALWHIVQIHSTEEYLLYLKRLKELGLILNQLSNFSEIIWLNQYPTAQFYGGMPYGGANDSDIIVSDKLYHYNEDIRHILELVDEIGTVAGCEYGIPAIQWQRNTFALAH
ncbi:hypothetical protein DAPPUDRAFT_253731 [Daphnia pulex]|uniref:Uncharacterized protein n=1 Tax=Daphnia pulex TaxID=6669 RepID=E9H5R7_DAPPU|nr:hypothetical protein DAPPUDRAFT_253731 [Daphnia pulex]|eukprot:EFX73039.1 hypothetical protein DAPPUDRAFT_253731 [Daphnia pulex]